MATAMVFRVRACADRGPRLTETVDCWAHGDLTLQGQKTFKWDTIFLHIPSHQGTRTLLRRLRQVKRLSQGR
jgi:hypothetical protein